MVSYFVRYCGTASDPRTFVAYYEQQHAGILRRFPNIRSPVLHRPALAQDPFPVHAGDTFLLAQMQFDSSLGADAIRQRERSECGAALAGASAGAR
jgi:hypothetical protein